MGDRVELVLFERRSAVTHPARSPVQTLATKPGRVLSKSDRLQAWNHSPDHPKTGWGYIWSSEFNGNDLHFVLAQDFDRVRQLASRPLTGAFGGRQLVESLIPRG